jgi:hypothetical protein
MKVNTNQKEKKEVASLKNFQLKNLKVIVGCRFIGGNGRPKPGPEKPKK